MTRTSIRFLLAPLALVFIGCSTAPDDVCTAERKLAVNKLATNKLATNKIATNSLLTATLPRVPLTSSSLAQAVPPEALEDEFAQSVLQYMVSCALTPEQSVEIPIAGGV